MKSLFKRSLAAATGSVLALTQLALMANVNISAEEATTAANDSSSAVTITKDEILKVPVTADMFKNAVLKDGVAEVGQTDIGSRVEAALLSSGDKTFDSTLASVKARLKTKMMEKGYIDSATADELLAAVKNATITVTTDGKITGSAKVDECGAAIGKAVENALLTRRGKAGIKADDGTPITIDWSKFKASGEILIDGQIDFANNSVTYALSAKTADGKTIDSVKAAEDYAKQKLTEAAGVVAEAAAASTAAGHPATKLASEIANYTGKGGNASKAAESFMQDVAAIKLNNYSVLDTLYADYMKEVNAAVAKSGLSDRNVTRVENQIEKYTPETAMSFFDNEKVVSDYGKAVEKFNAKFGDTVTLNLPLSDIKSVIEDAESQTKEEYKANYNINGFNADALLYIDDDAQQAELIAAANKAMTPLQFVQAGWTVVLNQEDGTVLTEADFTEDKEYEIIEVVAKKKIVAETENAVNFQGKASLDVTRLVRQIVVQVKETTTTSTSVTTEVTSSVGTDVTTDITTSVSTDVTGSETQPGGSDETTTSTTAATYISFEVSGNQLIFWTEETDKVMDLSEVSIMLHIIEGGVESSFAPVDVTDAFELETTNTGDLNQTPDGTGVMGQSVPFVVKDASVIENALKSTKYDGLAKAQGIENGYKDSSLYMLVDFVLRGDSNLDGVIKLADAQDALLYYTKTTLGQVTAKKYINQEGNSYLKNFEDKELYFPFSHYAMDAREPDGIIRLQDAQAILIYYTRYKLGQIPLPEGANPWEQEKVVGKHVDPLNDLHFDPFKFDPFAIDYRKDTVQSGN